MNPTSRFYWTLVLLLSAIPLVASPVRLRCEYLENPLGIDSTSPQLSWQNDSTERHWKQSAYQILVAGTQENLRADHADVWDSGRIESSDSVGIQYRGSALESRRRYYWKVRVWDTSGHASESEGEAWWEMGLLHPSDWTANWIHWSNPDDAADLAGIHWVWIRGQNALATRPKTAAVFRVGLNLSSAPRSAVLYVAARGDYIAKVNGHQVGNKHEWGAFDEHEIGDVLKVGENSIEVRVTSPEPPEWEPGADAKTTQAALAAVVKVINDGGDVIRIPTDEKWQARLETKSGWRQAHVVANLGDERFGDPGPLPQPATYFRRVVPVASSIRSARLYVTALGSYYFFINGHPIAPDVLTPDFTDYRKRVMYQTYDVTSQLAEGTNAIGALVGDGWYGSPLTWSGTHFFTPPDRFLAQLEIDYTDGAHATIATDSSWKAAPSPILRSHIYSGEIYDARLEAENWSSSSFDDLSWKAAEVLSAPRITLSSQITMPARVISEIQPKTVTALPNGSYVFDFGQNIVGWVRLRVKGSAGSRVRLRFAEILNADGTIYTQNLRNAEAADTYILRGGEPETFAPHFTFHGFRYVEMAGYPGRPTLDDIAGEVVSSVGPEPAAKLHTSSDLVNHMWTIGIWGQQGNFLSIPTDCPQRDERLGWMGDAGVFWRTGSYNFDIAAFTQKFEHDIVDAQTREGAFTNVSPDTLPDYTDDSAPSTTDMIGAPGWGDAGIIIPWTAWVQYGDKVIVEQNWTPMLRWMEFIQSRNPDFLRKNGVGPNFADWLAPDENTDKTLLATAYWALIADMMSQMAQALGKEADSKHFAELVGKIRSSFQKAYIKPDGQVGNGTQTSYVVALYTRMAPATLEPALLDRLVKDIESRNWHLSTGFLGTPFLLFTLADHGRADVAYRLLLNETYPSWGYMLSKGATTWWERWNGDTGDPAMNSYNHYAFGSVVAWVYRDVVGIDTSADSPAFKRIIVHPRLDERITSASGEYDSVYGKITTDWSGTSKGPFSLKLTIPANTSARVFLPAFAGGRLTEDGAPLQAPEEDGSYVVSVDAGSYHFEVK